MLSSSPGRFALVVCDTDLINRSSLSMISLTKLVFPAPEGAEIRMSNPLFIRCSVLAHVFARLRPSGLLLAGSVGVCWLSRLEYCFLD